MDNKRKGSSPPSSGGDEPAAREPMPREPSPFAFSDDDDSPLPAPPEFDGRRENVPELLEGDLMDDDVATAEELEAEEPELLEASMLVEIRPTHRMPPPIPAPVPTGPGRHAFVDDGEIALPPRITDAPKSFPFRQLRRDEPSGLFENFDDEPAPDSAGWRSASLRNEPAPPQEEEVEEAEEVDAEEIVEDEPPPPPRRSQPPQSPPHAPARPSAFTDDDPPPPRYRDPSRMFVDDEASETLAERPVFDDAESTELLADDHATALHRREDAEATTLYRASDIPEDDSAASRPPQPSAAIPVAALADDDDDAAWSVPAAPPSTTPDAEQFPASAEIPQSAPQTDDQPTDDDDDQPWSPPTREHDQPAASQHIAADDPMWSSPRDNHPPAVADDDNDWSPPHHSDERPVTDDDDDDWSPPARNDEQPVAEQPVAAAEDDSEWSPPARDDDQPVAEQPVAADDPMWSSPRDDDQPVAEQPVAADDPMWSSPRDDDQPVATRPVADDDADWSPPERPIATRPVADDDERPGTSEPTEIWSRDEQDEQHADTRPDEHDARLTEQLTPPPAATVDDDDEWSPDRPTALLPADDDIPSTQSPAFSGAIRVADTEEDDDDEWVPSPPAMTQAAPPPEPDEDDDDEWEPQTATVGLAPIPTDLGEAFPLDLWSDPDELISRELGRYRLIKPLSRGMVTRVYAGESLVDDKRVALRILAPTHSPAEPRARQFIHEAQQLTRLRGENLVEVQGSGSTPDHLSYYVMELLDGETLAAALRSEGPLPWADVAAFANQICDALIVASDRGVVHSDLTTATCLRLRPPADEPEPADGERRRAKIKLLDVGITPLVSVYRNSEGNLSVSQGTPPGTAEYMAPEIASGGRPDVHTEIYALGVIMYELLTGRPPFRGDSFLAVLKKQMYDEPVAPRLVVPEQDIPEAFEQVVLQALAKAPADRFADLRALDEALLGVRAREGELRRVTQILALDPTDWDEEGSRNAATRPPSVPAKAAAVVEPIPLATFAADLKEKNPELAAKVFEPPKPKEPTRPAAVKPPQPASPPPPSVQLTHLAAPVTAPPPVAPQQQQQVLVYHQPPTNAGLFNIRNISVGIIVLCLAVIGAMWLSDSKGKGKAKQEVAAETKRPAPAKAKKPTPKPTPEPVETPDPTPAKQVEPPTKQPEPEPVEPPPTKQTVAPEPVDPPPAKQVDPPPTTKPDPPTKKPDPVVKKDPYDNRPERIEPTRLKSKIASLEPRVRTACSAKSGMSNPSGLRVIVKVVVSPKGTTNVTATGAWANTPMGQCTEQVLEGMLIFNETRTGGTHKHTINF